MVAYKARPKRKLEAECEASLAVRRRARNRVSARQCRQKNKTWRIETLAELNHCKEIIHGLTEKNQMLEERVANLVSGGGGGGGGDDPIKLAETLQYLGIYDVGYEHFGSDSNNGNGDNATTRYGDKCADDGVKGVATDGKEKGMSFIEAGTWGFQDDDDEEDSVMGDGDGAITANGRGCRYCCHCRVRNDTGRVLGHFNMI